MACAVPRAPETTSVRGGLGSRGVAHTGRDRALRFEKVCPTICSRRARRVHSWLGRSDWTSYPTACAGAPREQPKILDARSLAGAEP
jgi:hypothetical protein